MPSLRRTLLLATAAACLIAAIGLVQPGSAQTDTRGRKHTLHATVDVVNEYAQSVRVTQEAIAGFSEARSATYKVDDPSILKRLEEGDRIAATIFEKDDTLYDIRVAQIYDVPAGMHPERPK